MIFRGPNSRHSEKDPCYGNPAWDSSKIIVLEFVAFERLWLKNFECRVRGFKVGRAYWLRV